MVLGNFWNGIHIVKLDTNGKVFGLVNDEAEYHFVAKGP